MRYLTSKPIRITVPGSRPVPSPSAQSAIRCRRPWASGQCSLPQFLYAHADASGDALVAVGAAYLSYGQPDMAAQLLSQGIAKGGLKSPEQATLLLGIAQLRSHNSAEAHGTFDKVASSSNEGYAQLGKFWVLYSGSQA